MQENYGEKTIGTAASYVYLVNQIFGPGVLAIPLVFVKSGFLPATFANLVVGSASALAATMLIKSVRMIPGNSTLDQRVELFTAVRHYYGVKWATVTQVLLHLSLQSLNVASILDVAMVFDKLLAQATGSTIALEIWPNTMHLGLFGLQWIEKLYNPSDDTTMFAITVGYLLVALLCLPMGFFNLDDNIVVQIISFIFLLLLMSEFIGQCVMDGIGVGGSKFTWPTMIGNDFSELLSVFIFSYSYSMLITPWANEAKKGVNLGKSVWTSALSSAFGYWLIGTLLAAAYPSIASNNILIRILGDKHTSTLTKIAAYSFAGTIVLPGIPVFCITARYDMQALLREEEGCQEGYLSLEEERSSDSLEEVGYRLSDTREATPPSSSSEMVSVVEEIDDGNTRERPTIIQWEIFPKSVHSKRYSLALFFLIAVLAGISISIVYHIINLTRT
eukprot:g5141.t1